MLWNLTAFRNRLSHIYDHLSREFVRDRLYSSHDSKWAYIHLNQSIFIPEWGIVEFDFGIASDLSQIESDLQQLQGSFSTIGEVGCNCGSNTFMLSRTFPNSKILAWDIDKDAIEVAKRLRTHYFYSNQIPANNISFYVGERSLQWIVDNVDLYVVCGFNSTFSSFYSEHYYPTSPLWKASDLQIAIMYPHIYTVYNRTPNSQEFLRTEASLQFQRDRTLQVFEGHHIGHNLLQFHALPRWEPSQDFLAQEWSFEHDIDQLSLTDSENRRPGEVY